MIQPKKIQRLINILNIISKSPKSIKKISKESSIPIASTYRIIQELERQDLVLRKGMIDNLGNRVGLYKSKLRTANFTKITNQLTKSNQSYL